MVSFYSRQLLASFAAACALWPALASAAPFTPGNIVVARVGDGSATLSTAATEVFLDEYTPGGLLVQSVALPTSVSGTNRVLTASGTATAELALTRSANGAYLVLAGYGAAPGTTGVITSQTTDVARVIGLIGPDGNVDTSTSTGDAFNGVSIRAVATADGSSFYSVGANSGVRYQAFGSAMSTQLNAAPLSIRTVNVSGGNLYVATNSNPNVGLSQVGTGLPTTDGQTVTALPGFPATATGASPYGFYLADLSDAVPGADVAYVADDRTTGGGIQKWSLVGGSWVLNGTITASASSAVRGLSGSTTGTAVSLAASSSNSLFILTDDAGYNVAPSLAALPAAIATADANTAFRGLAFSPVALAPTIASFTPTTGGPATVITITGTNFTGATTVSIGSLSVTDFTVVSATTITLVVPSSTNPVSGPLTVVTPGGTATSTASFSLVLAVAASQAMPGLTVSPNPATDQVLVTLPKAGAATVALHDLTGRQVLAPQPLAANQLLNLPASLAAGVYLLEVQQGAEKAVRRLEKK